MGLRVIISLGAERIHFTEGCPSPMAQEDTERSHSAEVLFRVSSERFSPGWVGGGQQRLFATSFSPAVFS